MVSKMSNPIYTMDDDEFKGFLMKVFDKYLQLKPQILKGFISSIINDILNEREQIKSEEGLVYLNYLAKGINCSASRAERIIEAYQVTEFAPRKYNQARLNEIIRNYREDSKKFNEFVESMAPRKKRSANGRRPVAENEFNDIHEY